MDVIHQCRIGQYNPVLIEFVYGVLEGQLGATVSLVMSKNCTCKVLENQRVSFFFFFFVIEMKVKVQTGIKVSKGEKKNSIAPMYTHV